MPGKLSYNTDRGIMFQRRITKLALIIVVVSFLTSTGVSLWSLHVMSQRNQEELSKILTAQIYDVITGELSDAIMVSRTMAGNVYLISTLQHEDDPKSKEAIKSYLNGIQNHLNYEMAFIVSADSRKYYTRDGINKIVDPSKDEYDQWYTDFLNTGLEYDLDVDNDELSHGEWTVFVNCRINDRENNLLGVGGVGVRMVRTQQKLKELEKEYNVHVCMVDKDHLVQVDIVEDNIENLYLEHLILPEKGSPEYIYQRLDSNHIAVTRYIDSLDWYLVMESDGSNERGQFVNVILLNIVLFLLILLLLVLAIQIIAKRTAALTAAFLKDAATGLYNRRALEEVRKRYGEKKPEPDLVYMIADVNGLKTANDTLGHDAGDEMIQGTAELLERNFGKYGTVYRIGGDEFAAILRISDEALDKVRRDFEQQAAQWHGEKVPELAVSCGYVRASEMPEADLEELSRKADERMYAAKEEYYLTSGKDRRKHGITSHSGDNEQ